MALPLLCVVFAWVGGPLKAFDYSLPYGSRMRQLLQEVHVVLAILDARRAEGVGPGAGSDDQIVVGNVEEVALEDILATDALLLHVEGLGLRLIVVDVRNGTDGLLDAAVLQSSNCCGWKHRRKHEVVSRRDENRLELLRIESAGKEVASPARPNDDDTFLSC